jgi:hypothetical protein
MRERFIEIFVDGDVADPLEAEFDDFEVTVDREVTRMRGVVRDASALFGTLDHITSLGFELLRVRDADVAAVDPPD